MGSGGLAQHGSRRHLYHAGRRQVPAGQTAAELRPRHRPPLAAAVQLPLTLRSCCPSDFAFSPDGAGFLSPGQAQRRPGSGDGRRPAA
jgi:hypothetical protein